MKLSRMNSILEAAKDTYELLDKKDIQKFKKALKSFELEYGVEISEIHEKAEEMGFETKDFAQWLVVNDYELSDDVFEYLEEIYQEEDRIQVKMNMKENVYNNKEPWEVGGDKNRAVYGFSAKSLENKHQFTKMIWENAVSTAKRFKDMEAYNWLITFEKEF